jgi:hypothetical protein
MLVQEFIPKSHIEALDVDPLVSLVGRIGLSCALSLSRRASDELRPSDQSGLIPALLGYALPDPARWRHIMLRITKCIIEFAYLVLAIAYSGLRAAAR